MKYVDPPFELGETLSGTDDSGTLINNEVLGKCFEFPLVDLDASNVRGGKARLTGKTIKAIALRNESGIALLGKRVAKLTETAGYSVVESVDGYAAEIADANVVVIDEFLPSAGVADDDIFWGIISGPVNVLLPTVSNDHNGDVVVGNWLVAATGSTTGNSTSGRVSNIAYTAATSGSTVGFQDIFKMCKNVIGVAMSAATTHNTTGVEMLIDARIQL